MFDTSTATLIERVRAGFGRRAVGIAAALTLEALILLLLLSLGASNFSPRRPATTLTTFEASSSPDAPADEPGGIAESGRKRTLSRPVPSAMWIAVYPLSERQRQIPPARLFHCGLEVMAGHSLACMGSGKGS